MILVKTDAGQQVLKDRSLRLTPRQRSAFILCDGKRSIDQVLAAGMGIAREDIEELIGLGLLGPAVGPQPTDAPVERSATSSEASGAPLPASVQAADPMHAMAAASGAEGSGRSLQQRYKDAYPIATRLTGALGLRGFRLNLAVEGTTSYEELAALGPKIRSAVGPEKAAELERALGF